MGRGTKRRTNLDKFRNKVFIVQKKNRLQRKNERWPSSEPRGDRNFPGGGGGRRLAHKQSLKKEGKAGGRGKKKALGVGTQKEKRLEKKGESVRFELREGEPVGRT